MEAVCSPSVCSVLKHSEVSFWGGTELGRDDQEGAVTFYIQVVAATFQKECVSLFTFISQGEGRIRFFFGLAELRTGDDWRLWWIVTTWVLEKFLEGKVWAGPYFKLFQCQWLSAFCNWPLASSWPVLLILGFETICGFKPLAARNLRANRNSKDYLPWWRGNKIASC